RSAGRQGSLQGPPGCREGSVDRLCELALRAKSPRGRLFLVKTNEGKAFVVERRFFLSRALIDDLQVLLIGVLEIGCDQITGFATRRVAETIDLALHLGACGDNGVVERIAFEKVVRQLIEGTVEIVVDRGIGLIDANQNFPRGMLVPI